MTASHYVQHLLSISGLRNYWPCDDVALPLTDQRGNASLPLFAGAQPPTFGQPSLLPYGSELSLRLNPGTSIGVDGSAALAGVFTAPFTLSVVCRVDAFPPTSDTWSRVMSVGGQGNPGEALSIRMSAGQEQVMWVAVSSAGIPMIVSTPLHVVLARNDGQARAWYNSQSAGWTSLAISLLNQLYLGQTTAQATVRVSQIALWNRVLTDQEVADLWSAYSQPPPTAGVVKAWNGSAWIEGQLKGWDGSQWKQGKVWDGSDWR